MLLDLSSDLLKLILFYLLPRELSLIAPTCHRFNALIKGLFPEKALAGRTLPEHLKDAYRHLEPHLKPWQRYLLIKASFYEVEFDSMLLMGAEYFLMLALRKNQADLVSHFIIPAYAGITKTISKM